MIVSGLKKGAVFEDGGLFYVVKQVLESGNYISKRLSEEERKALEVAEKAKETTEKPPRKNRKKAE